MTWDFDRQFLESQGFEQLVGANEGVLSDGHIEYWPTYTNKYTPGRWCFPDGRFVDAQLQPRTKTEVLIFLGYLALRRL